MECEFAPAPIAAGRRERGKAQRRAALLAAARTSLADGEFSMRRIAQIARVSDVTPYNLFGSKHALLAWLYRELVLDSEARLPAPGVLDPLQRFVAAIRSFAAGMSAQPAFYRNLFAARIESRGGRPFPQTFDEGVDYWRRLFDAMVAEGQVEAGASADMLGRHFVHLLAGGVQDWIDGVVQPDAWQAQVTHGFALLALPLASPSAATALQRILADAAARLPGVAPGAARLRQAHA